MADRLNIDMVVKAIAEGFPQLAAQMNQVADAGGNIESSGQGVAQSMVRSEESTRRNALAAFGLEEQYNSLKGQISEFKDEVNKKSVALDGATQKSGLFSSSLGKIVGAIGAVLILAGPIQDFFQNYSKEAQKAADSGNFVAAAYNEQTRRSEELGSSNLRAIEQMTQLKKLYNDVREGLSQMSDTERTLLEARQAGLISVSQLSEATGVFAYRQKLLREAAADGVVTIEEQIAINNMSRQGMLEYADTLANNVAPELENYIRLTRELGIEMSSDVFAGWEASGERWSGLAEMFGEIPEEPARDAGRRLGGALVGGIGEMVKEVSSTALQALTTDIQLKMAGGDELAEQIRTFLRTEMSDEDALEVGRALTIKAADIELEAGVINADEFEEVLRNNFEGPIEDALGHAEGVLANLSALSGMEIDAGVNIHVLVDGETWIASLISGGVLTGTIPLSGGEVVPPGQRGVMEKKTFEATASGGPLNIGGWTLIGEGPSGDAPYAELVSPDGMVHSPEETRRIMPVLRALGIVPRGLAGGGPLLDGVAGVGAVSGGGYRKTNIGTAIMPSFTMGPGWGTGGAGNPYGDGYDPSRRAGDQAPSSSMNTQAAAAAAQAAAQVAAAAAQAAAVGVGASVAQKGQQQAEQAMAAFVAETQRSNSRLEAEVRGMRQDIRNQPSKTDLKNAVLEAMSEAQ